MIYADSSFLIRLLCHEAGSAEAVELLRALGYPAMVFTEMHGIEVRNGLRLKAFVEMRSLPRERWSEIAADLSGWESRLERYLDAGTMAVTDTDWSRAIRLALDLSEAHTVEMGTRAYDILHVALAGLHPERLFVTSDRRQARLAQSAGLDTRLAEPAVG